MISLPDIFQNAKTGVTWTKLYDGLVAIIYWIICLLLNKDNDIRKEMAL